MTIYSPILGGLALVQKRIVSPDLADINRTLQFNITNNY